jgi:hypothetical protein
MIVVSQYQHQFDLTEALKAQDQGVALVAKNNAEFLDVARKTARQIAAKHGVVTADDVREVCPMQPRHSNAWGALFRERGWRHTGEFRKSRLVQGHGNLQRVWRFDPQYPKRSPARFFPVTLSAEVPARGAEH